MGPIIYVCNLCGWIVADLTEPVSWLNQFRGLVSNPPGDVSLTGVGLYYDVMGGSCIAPPEADTRWDDSGYEQAECDELGVGLRAGNGRYGFIFHASCWSLLERAACPTDIPHTKLYEICLSLPRPFGSSCVSWGHDYGGLLVKDDEHHFPWEGGESWLACTDSTASDEEDAKQINMTSVLKGDPFNIPEIQSLLSEKPEPPPSIQLGSTTRSSGDPFLKLPEEILIQIALSLPTADALNARLASKGFWGIFDSDQFWVSRFKGYAERSWLFETNQIDAFRDWRWLYHRTNRANLGSAPAVQNRRRVWDLAQKVVGIWRQLKFNAVVTGTSSASDTDMGPWVEASGDVKSVHPDAPHVDFYEGCRVLHRQRQSLTHLGSLSQVAFSFIEVGNAKLLAGIRLIPQVGGLVQIGYQTESEQTLDISTLRGFVLALGSRGVHAIQCLTDHHDHPWCGDPGNSPRTRRLATRDLVTALEVGLDGCKIVSLSIASSISHPPGAKTLRDAAVWYPHTPGPQLCLNEDFYVQREHHVLGYRPLIWTLFGGPGGIYLPSLTGISVHVGDSLPGIDFTYDSPDIPNEYRTLGRHKCDIYAPGCEMPWEFAIDGPGGERINGIEVYLSFMDDETSCEIYGQGALESIKVFTNQGRSFHFRDEAMNGYKDNRMVVKKFNAATGTAITGFYTRQFVDGDLNYGMASLGIITEAI